MESLSGSTWRHCRLRNAEGSQVHLWAGLGMAGGGQGSRQNWFLRPVLAVYGLIHKHVVGNGVRV